MPDFPVTAVEGDGIRFRLADPGHALPGVRLWVDVDVDVARDFVACPGGWELGVGPLPVDRVEYLFEVGDVLVLDPGNPLTVPGAFGDHSWLPLPGYRPPAWLEQDGVAGLRSPVRLAGTPVGEVAGEVWAPLAVPREEPLPLLVCHDGPEMDAFGGLIRYVAAMVAQGRLPLLRVALLAPGDRDDRYAANELYAETLAGHLVPALCADWATEHAPVLVGQSLGALAALHAAWTRPGVFGGLFLQSGSYFTPELDPQESGYPHWDRVTGFVRSVHDAARLPATLPPVTLVCGTAEENLANNRLMARQLATLGVPTSWGQARDGHTWTCWRDLLDPHLTALLTRVWS